MSLHLIVSNPPRATKRSTRARKVRRRRSRIQRNPGGVIMAKRSRRRRRRAGSGGFPLIRRARRSSRRRGGGRALGGFVSRDVLTGAAGAVAGYIGTNLLLEKAVPADWINSDGKRIAAKAALALGGAFVLRRMGLSMLARGLAVGGLVAAGIDAARKAQVPGVSGLGEFGIGEVASFDYAALPSSTTPGLGCGVYPSSDIAVS
jgi:hypothetical protein